MEYWQKTEHLIKMYKVNLLCINAVLIVTLVFLSHHPLFGMVSKIDIQGIVLLGCSEDLIEEDYSSYKGIHHLGLKLPGNALTLERQLAGLIGKSIDKETIAEGENTILQFYKMSGHPLVSVRVPEQKISDGILQYIVSEAVVGKVSFSGNEWTPTRQLEKELHQKPGETLDTNLLEKDLIWLNRNPFRNTLMILNPGDEEGTTDLQFVSEDHFPYRIYIGGDNTGFDATGKGRFFAGVNFGNLFHLDQRLSYQYTVSTKWGNFYAHTGQYVIPLPWRHILEFYGGYSGIHALMPFTGMSSSGNAWQASARYIVPLTPVGAYTHELKVGFDYKQTNVNLVFDAIPILGNQAVVTQLVFGYFGAYEHKIADTSLEFQWFASPGDIFPHQSKKDYSSLRPNAKSRYAYFRAAIIPVFHLPKEFEAVLKTEFQAATQNLLSSEQFGLGGLYTVRGYDERILNTDNAFLMSGEVRSPSMPLFTKKGTAPSVEMLQALVFVDYGFGVNHEALPGSRNYLYLLSTGLGLRYRYKYHVTGRVDWGVPLHRHIQRGVTQNGSHFNFSIIFSY
jgi:hemolysin activation/secretion protein